VRLGEETKGRQVTLVEPSFQTLPKLGCGGGAHRFPFLDMHAFVCRPPYLLPQRRLRGENGLPALGVPDGLRSEQNTRMGRKEAIRPQGLRKPVRRAEVTDAVTCPPGLRLPAFDDIWQTILGTDRRAPDNAYPPHGVPNIPDDSVSLGGEPVGETGVQNLKTDRVPALLQHQFSRPSDLLHPILSGVGIIFKAGSIN
jgi:hypothetical protein